MKTRTERINETKTAILLLLNSEGPQGIAEIAVECKSQAYLGMMAFALAGLTFDGEIFWDSLNDVYFTD